MQGLLAESWEQQDTQTLIFHIRKGVYWQNLPPVNGRLLTAHDIEWNYDRMLGLGDGFTKPAPTVGLGQWAMIKSITATDNYTVVFKSSYPSLDMLNSLLDPNQPNYIEAPEEVQAWGNTADWHHTVGTGPFILKDYVSGSSLTYIKNPNYWGYDERHPENRLPYVDGLEALIIPDQSTFMAGVRSGKIDLIDTLTLVQAENMAKTNPDITQFKLPNNAFCLLMRDDKAPFTDIRVREALQMAVDLPTIAATYYQGVVDGTPYPLCGPYLTGDYYPYAEWPQQLKDTYTYNVAGAKQLLADAGYPNGFNTTLAEADSGRTSDTDLCQIVKSYFSAIGVNMTINVMSAANFQVLTRVSRSVDQMAFTGTGALTYPPLISILNRDSTQASSLNCVHDPVYDKMCDAASAATDLAQQTTLIQQCDKYAVEHHWDVVLPQTVTFNLCQPWLEGYSGEFILNSWGAYMSRWWINQDIKKGK